MEKSYHVVKSKKGWAVRKTGDVEITTIYKNEEDAIQKGKEIAQNQKANLYIHGADGVVKEKIIYSKEGET